MMNTRLILALVAAAVVPYLIGTLSNATLICRAKNVDIRSVGSGNPGGTNVIRALGTKWGVLVMALDAVKGAIGALAGWLIVGLLAGWEAGAYGVCVGSITVICGHNWPVFAHFRGGKGIASTLGVLLVLSPVSGVLGLVLHQLILWTSGYMSLASIVASTFAAGVTLVVRWGQPAYDWYLVTTLFIWLASLFTHRGNIQRLLNGTEKRLIKKDKK